MVANTHKISENERASAKIRRGQVLFGVVLLSFGILQIIDKASLALPKSLAIVAGFALLGGLVYAAYVDHRYTKAVSSYTDEYQAVLIKNGQANAFRFFVFSLFIMAFLNDAIARHTSLSGVLFAVIGTGMLIATLYTSYESKKPAQ